MSVESLSPHEEYFCGDSLPAKVWVDKYALRDKNNNVVETTPDEMHWRLAREFSRVDRAKFGDFAGYSPDFVYGFLKDFKYIIPQGGPMYGIGNPYQMASLSNCYTIAIPGDSYGAILHADEQLVQISKRRGGVGIDLSALRPSGFATSNAARTTSGIVAWMRRYSNSIREVGQNGRRGALMETLSVHHPQVLDFARAKLDKKDVTGANVSVRLTDEFMEAVKEGRDYVQCWPVDAKEPEFVRHVDAREVWRELIRCAWQSAEPGLLFWDNILRESPADCYADVGFRTVSTNPCQPGWAKLLTPSGIRQMKDVNEGDLIWSKSGWTKVVRKWSSGVKQVFRYGTTSCCFFGTRDHRLVCQGHKVRADEAEAVDILSGPFALVNEYDQQAVMDGLMIGDGSWHNASSKPYLNIGHKDFDYFSSEVSRLIVGHNSVAKHYRYGVVTTATRDELAYTYLRKVPTRYIEGNLKIVVSFLRGLYSANGSVVAGRVTLKASSFRIVEDVQLMLSSVGIRSYYTTNREHVVRFVNGDYTCRQSYDLNITVDREKFLQLIGFIQNYKNEKLASYIRSMNKAGRPPKSTYDIVKEELVSEEEVFDIAVDNDTSTYWTQGCDVSNCSELPLCPLDSCRLLLLNLFSYVSDPFTKDARFNSSRFVEHARVAQRLMDDLIDLELECIDRILQKVEADPEPAHVKERELNLWKTVYDKCFQGRRTGTGLTAVGDTLAALGIPYGSDKSIDFVEKVYRDLKLACYRESVEMAKKLGPFPVWDAEKEKDCPFLKRIKDEDPQLYEDMQKYGRRNIALLTTAPAGSVSLVAGPRPYFQTTSGIEPLFTDAPYTRRKKINDGDTESRIDFVDQNGDRWQHFEVFHPKIRMWMDVTGETDWAKSPYHGCCANDLDWTQRVKLQAAAQLHLDHGISSTVNVPKEVSQDEVAEIYLTAWEAGCKGITVYRDGCRDGVLVQGASPPEKVNKTKAPKRPKDLPCDIHVSRVKGVDYTVLVGLFGGEPYEVIAGPYKDIKTRCQHGKGALTKVGRGHYRLVSGEEVLCESVTAHCDDDQEALTRMVSTSLRHGADISFVVTQLSKVRGHIMGFAKCLARVLKKYVKDGTIISGEQCEACGGKLLFAEGCSNCPGCGWSKCS